MIGIYKITSPSKRVYVGQSINLESRFKEYNGLNNCKGQIKIYNSLKKYSPEKHVFEILEICEIEELNIKERYYQDLFDCMGKNGLNLRLTGHKDASGVLSAETREKIGIHSRGEKNYFYGKRFVGALNPFYGKKHTEDFIKNNFCGEKNPMYGRSGKLNPAYGMKHDPEFLRRKQILHSNPVEVYSYDKLIHSFECVSDAAKHFGCTKENIRFRAKIGLGKFGMFKGLLIKLIHDKTE